MTLAPGPPPSFLTRAPVPGTDIRAAAARNRLLAGWPDDVREQLLAQASLAPLRANHLLFEAGVFLSHALFPVSGLIVALQRDESGASVVVGHGGIEGCIGSLAVFSEASTTWCEINVLLRGEALSLPIAHLRDVVASSPVMTRDLTVYNQHILQVSLQNVICSRFHSVAARTACWLLLLHDRLDGADQIPITHGLLSQVLGVRRPSVTLALHELGALGVLGRGRGRRGIVEVRDRAQLEQVSCECYATLQQNDHLRTA